jgi:hypothetical protein
MRRNPWNEAIPATKPRAALALSHVAFAVRSASRAGRRTSSVTGRTVRSLCNQVTDPALASSLWSQIDRELVDEAPVVSGSPFVPRFQFDCGSAGTFYSEVLSLPTEAAPTVAPPDAAAGLPGFAVVRLLTTTSGETNQVFVLLAVVGDFTNPGLVANQSNPNLVTCTITRPNGSQFEAVGLLTPGG